MQTSTSRPFTALINALRRDGHRYQDLVNKSNEARSSAWFNNLVNGSDPWAVSPPAPAAWPGLAALFGVSVDHLKAAIAEEWFGAQDGGLTARERGLVDVSKRLIDDDHEMLRRLAVRLAQPVKSASEQLDDFLKTDLEEDLPDFSALGGDGGDAPR